MMSRTTLHSCRSSSCCLYSCPSIPHRAEDTPSCSDVKAVRLPKLSVPIGFSPNCVLLVGWQYVLLSLGQSQLSLGSPSVIINSMPFYSQKYPSMSNKLYDRSSYWSFHRESGKGQLLSKDHSTLLPRRWCHFSSIRLMTVFLANHQSG